MMDLFNINFFIAASLGVLVADFFKSCFTDMESDRKEVENFSKESLSLKQVESLIFHSNPELTNNIEFVLNRLNKKYNTLLCSPDPSLISREIYKEAYVLNLLEFNKALRRNIQL